MNHDVFISYSKKDAQRIKPLREALTAAGIKYWIDDRIDGSANFLAEIPEAIRRCSIVLFVASKSSANSEWTQKELVYARKLNKEIFPYKLDNFQFDNCPELDFFFANIQWKESVDDVVSGLVKKLGAKVSAPTQVSPQESASVSKKATLQYALLFAFIVVIVGLVGYFAIPREHKVIDAEENISEATIVEENVNVADVTTVEETEKSSSQTTLSEASKTQEKTSKNTAEQTSATAKTQETKKVTEQKSNETKSVSAQSATVTSAPKVVSKNMQMSSEITKIQEKAISNTSEHVIAYRVNKQASRIQAILEDKISSEKEKIVENKYKEYKDAYTKESYKDIVRRIFGNEMLIWDLKLPENPSEFVYSTQEEVLRVKVMCDVLIKNVNGDTDSMTEECKATYNHIVKCINAWEKSLENVSDTIRLEIKKKELDVCVKIARETDSAPTFGLG